jgi:Domain of unknown function (DUF4832)/Domain of unknown function (DUF4874)
MLASIGLVFACACATPAVTPDPNTPLTAQNYEPSVEDFPNPERGFYQQEAIMWLGTERSPLQPSALRQLRLEGVSSLRLYILIDEFRDAALSADALTYIRAEFGKARDAGLKLIPRFAYNFPQGGSYPYQDPDAPLNRVLEHIAQLQPVLRDNADIISFMEVGFVGAWGEWHSSTNKLVNPDTGINDASKAIVNRLLEALPNTRTIALRYPPHKQQLFGDKPLEVTEAHTGTNRARTGAHDDCFLASATNWGTFPENPAAREAMKTYLELDNRFLPQGGETCNVGADAQPFIGCDNALKDLQRTRYTTLNRGYHLEVYARWQREGCLETVKRRLGYRFELLESNMPDALKPGAAFALKLQVKNDGFAAPFNPRGVAVVLRAQTGGKTHRLTITDGAALPDNRALDPRFWASGTTTNLETTLQLPAGLEPGRYDVLLHLFDPEPALTNRPEYAIRLANQGVWEAQTGMNKLRVLEVK